jgi:anti-sigma regulatory factor (Ser/Thr protein kinase)
MAETRMDTAPGVPSGFPSETLTIDLPTDPAAPSTARRAIREILGELPLSREQVFDIELVTSELVTNAVEHGGGPQRMEVVPGRTELTVRVYDRGPSRPVRRIAASGSTHSRGLPLVDALSGSWGCTEVDGVKFVWATFPLDG